MECLVEREIGKAETAGDMTQWGWCGGVDDKSENNHWDWQGRTGSHDVEVLLMSLARHVPKRAHAQWQEKRAGV